MEKKNVQTILHYYWKKLVVLNENILLTFYTVTKHSYLLSTLWLRNTGFDSKNLIYVIEENPSIVILIISSIYCEYSLIITVTTMDIEVC
jgi:hypothetical protein